jgi:hypothetical protein
MPRRAAVIGPVPIVNRRGLRSSLPPCLAVPSVGLAVAQHRVAITAISADDYLHHGKTSAGQRHEFAGQLSIRGILSSQISRGFGASVATQLLHCPSIPQKPFSGTVSFNHPPRRAARAIEQVGSPLLLRVIRVFDLEPPHARAIRIVQALGDDPSRSFAHMSVKSSRPLPTTESGPAPTHIRGRNAARWDCDTASATARRNRHAGDGKPRASSARGSAASHPTALLQSLRRSSDTRLE